MRQLKPYLTGEKQGKVVGITFDDGYIDNLSTVAPIMNSLNLPFTVFVTTGFLDKKYKNFMNKNNEIVKNNNPYKWLSGHIDKDLIVGESIIKKEINNIVFLLILFWFKDKHL